MRIRTSADAAPVCFAVSALPELLRERLAHVDFFAGSDPVFAGLHGFRDASLGRSYREVAHFCYPEHVGGGNPTVVSPSPEHPVVVVHELGHALHELFRDAPIPPPVSTYAGQNAQEAFAEAFTVMVAPEAWLTSSYDGWRDVLVGCEFMRFIFDVGGVEFH